MYTVRLNWEETGSGKSKMAAIMNLQLTVRSGSVGNSYVEFWDLVNVDISVQIALLFCMGTKL